MFKLFSQLRVVGIVAAFACVSATTPPLTKSAHAQQTNDEQRQVSELMAQGKRILLVETIRNDVIVFGDNHNVAGPVSEVLGSMGFELVLPPGVQVADSEYAEQPLDVLLQSEVDHVFLMNFSQDESFVGGVQSQLAEMVDGRLYRIDSTVSQAFSQQWNSSELAPQVKNAILNSDPVTSGSNGAKP